MMWPFRRRERFTADLTHLSPWLRPENGGMVLHFGDWGWPRPRDPEVGEYVILRNPAVVGLTTRYRVTSWDRPSDPGDQFIATGVFAPRRGKP